MPASTKAKEKYAMALDGAWQHHTSYPNRMLTTRHPSTGGCEVVNSVTRRTSHSSHGSGNGRIKTLWRNIISPPAF